MSKVSKTSKNNFAARVRALVDPDELIEKMRAVARNDSKTESTRDITTAIRWLVDRGWGTPTQRVEMERPTSAFDVNKLSGEQLNDLEKLLTAGATDAELLDDE